jgi:hypothetical protein
MRTGLRCPGNHASASGRFLRPLLATARFLERPQGAQRRLLRLGETPDAGDSESLVGPISPQRFQRLAAPDVPEPDGPVISATGEPASIGTSLERLHSDLMRLLHPHTLATLHLPPAQPAVTASTNELLSTWSTGLGTDEGRLPGTPNPAAGACCHVKRATEITRVCPLEHYRKSPRKPLSFMLGMNGHSFFGAWERRIC